MKSCITFFLFFVIFTRNIPAQESRVFENGIVKSSILKENMKFSIYLPPGYDSSERSYPVLYLLHGRTDDNNAWIQFGDMQSITDTEVKAGNASPMIIVMPDAKLTFYMNDVDGKYRYEDYFIKELIPYIEKNYRCRSSKEFRAIAGLSMGGFGCLLYAIHYPDLFASCCALSPAVRTDEQIINMPDSDYAIRYDALLHIKKGENRITDFYNQNSILYLLKKMPDEQKSEVRFYIDCGDDDFLYKGNAALHVLMRDLNIPHEFRIRDGMHEWEYWRTGLPDVLKFVSKDFHR